MAAACSASTTSSFGGLTATRLSERFLVSQPRTYLTLPRLPFPRSALVFSRRRNDGSAVTSSKKKKKKKNDDKKKKCLTQSDDLEEDDLDVDPIEALFRQLEDDLKKDNPSMGDTDDEISEEDLARLERELEEALGEDDELSRMLDLAEDQTTGDEDVEEEEEERPLQLKNWQLRRLASALKIGRRKTSIKSLAAELCLDRAVVLELLRDPPPNLVLMSAALPDKVETAISEPETKSTEPSSVEEKLDVVKPETKVREPVHVMQSRWSTQKRLKKVHVETFEKVYRRTKRPSNTMISSIVHVTNLPRKRVLKWFEDKRTEEGVPDHHLPYQRSQIQCHKMQFNLTVSASRLPGHGISPSRLHLLPCTILLELIQEPSDYPIVDSLVYVNPYFTDPLCCSLGKFSFHFFTIQR
ncbi:protein OVEREXPRESSOR OF CATIONIC PEROXIDASE 3-like isoform X2 [Macadamia integrifolia]|uniref:protein OVEREXPRESSOR OF CATIONIC PEROXIDASE 3-like isoform X2 n=1 Tax=Macadamia integrifolia TaxID=60698 RepID=UPI001C4F87C2|nr:protein OVEREXPRESSOR OF CATIONIC PEROXIDASE 3-like isoform X2 [Macadamia integrifolia]